jgi:hypothetical protein
VANQRFQNLEKLKIMELLDCQKRNEHKNNFPEAAFQSLKRNYGQHFDFPELCSKLIAAYGIEDFSGKSVSETVTFLRQTGLAEDGFSVVYKLCCLIFTVPASSAYVECSFSTLKRAKSYDRNTQTKARL